MKKKTVLQTGKDKDKAPKPVRRPKQVSPPRRPERVAALQEEAAGKAKAAHQAEAKPRIYEVQPGDSLSKIAKEILGDAARWPEILEANKDQIKDPNLIRVGQKLEIPS